MKFSTLSKAGFAASVCAALAAMSTGAHAGTLQDTIFAKVEPSARDRMFFRLSYISANIKTTSKDAYDVTGPVLARGDATRYLLTDNNPSFATSFTFDGSDMDYSTAAALLDGNNLRASLLDSDVAQCPSEGGGLGTPCGIKAKGVSRVATAALSVGYFIDDAMTWAVEAFVLAAPINASVNGDGRNQIAGKKIIETKLLPPIVMLGHYFGTSSSLFRPYLGFAASYAIFYDTKATSYLNTYQGGGSPGDTTVRIGNELGFGPFVGLKIQPHASDWHFSVNVGKIRYKTETTLTTRNTVINSDSLVLKDFGPSAQQAIFGGANTYARTGDITVNDTGPIPSGYAPGQVVGLTTALVCDLAKAKLNSNDCTMGTYVRKASTTLDNTMFMFSVGRSF